MPHITEDTVANLREHIVKGARIERQFWKDDTAPHAYVGSFHTAQYVTWHPDGAVTISVHYYEEGRRTPRTMDMVWHPSDVVAIAAMAPLGDDGAQTYAHHDDRLTLPGGYMDAVPGTMHRTWNVHAPDGTTLDAGATVAEGRALLDACTCADGDELDCTEHGH